MLVSIFQDRFANNSICSDSIIEFLSHIKFSSPRSFLPSLSTAGGFSKVLAGVLVVINFICPFDNKNNLTAAACKDREFAVNDQFGESLIFGPKIPVGELFSKIIFKSSSDFLILRDSQKFENAVKVRFFRPTEGSK